MLIRLFFTQLFASERKQIAFMTDEKSPARISHRLFVTSRSEKRIIMLEHLMIAEQNILLWLQNNMRNDILNHIMIFITSLGNAGAIWIIMAVGLLIPKKTRKTGIMVISGLLLSFIINNIILKNLVARTRPYDMIAGLTSLVGIQSDYSFPSGHTASSFVAAVIMLGNLPKKYGVPAIILAFLIAFSRMYVGVHYPSDVIAGALIATAIGLFVNWVGKQGEQVI